MSVGRPTPEALRFSSLRRRASVTPTSRLRRKAMVWASRRYGDANELRRWPPRPTTAAFFPDGAPRQLAAIFASGDRSDELAQLDVPTLVIHGRDDTLISPDGGCPHRRTDSDGQPDHARRHGPRPSRTAVAGDRGRHGGARQSGVERVGKLAAVRTMLEEHVEHLPVVEDGRLVGICTRTDVLSARRMQIEHERRQAGWSQAVLPRMFARWSPAGN